MSETLQHESQSDRVESTQTHEGLASPVLDSYGAKLRLQALANRSQAISRDISAIDRELARLENVHRGLEDFYWFCKYVLEFKQLYQPLHGPLCADVADETKKRKLFLLPRGHFKTTIISICYPIWLLCRNQNARIAVISISADKAEEHLAEIRDRVRRPKFKELYGHILGDPSSWPQDNAKTIRVPRTGSVTGPSIAAYGVDSKEVGRHFDYMLLDDIVDQEKVNSPMVRDSIWAWFGRQFSVLDPGCCMTILGTNWHDDDVYSRVQRSMPRWSEEHPLGWIVVKRKAVENGQCIFPTRFNKTILEEIRRVQGDYLYSCFYDNDPIGEGMNPFDIKKFQWVEYDPESWEDDGFEHTAPIPHLFVDPAASEENWGCYSGIVLCYARSDRRVVIREAWLEKLPPDKLVDKIFELCKEYHITRVGIEDEALQRSLVYWIRREMSSRGVYFTAIPVKIPRNIKGDARLSAIQPFIHRGDIIFDQRMQGRDHILEEFSRFPKASHKDLMASIAMIPHCVMYPARRATLPQAPDTSAAVEFVERLCNRRPARRESRWDRVKVRSVR